MMEKIRKDGDYGSSSENFAVYYEAYIGYGSDRLGVSQLFEHTEGYCGILLKEVEETEKEGPWSAKRY